MHCKATHELQKFKKMVCLDAKLYIQMGSAYNIKWIITLICFTAVCANTFVRTYTSLKN